VNAPSSERTLALAGSLVLRDADGIPPPILNHSVTLLISIFTVLTGLAFGSFLNVCISRLPLHESIVHPCSRCPRCLTPIRRSDNIPILSWLLLRGRCRNCGTGIVLRYPLIEATTAALFLLCFLEFGLTIRGIGSAVLCWLLLGLAATDAETLLLPDALTLPGLALGAIYSGLQPSLDLVPSFSWKTAALSLLWAGCAGALLLMVRGLYWLARRREGLGLGDVKFLAMIAAWLGPSQTMLVLFTAVIAAAIYGLILIALKRLRTDLSTQSAAHIPLGAFLGAAGLFTLFEGELTLNWYMNFLR
jgi:leader peptidase (prepilin peptidase)/N-methyltransferase